MKYLVNIKDYLQPKGADIFKIIFIGILKILMVTMDTI